MDVSSFSMDTVSDVLVTIIILTVLIFCYVIGTLIVFLRYYNYTITQRDNELKITYGLLNVKNVTVPTERLQAVIENSHLLESYLDIPLYTLLLQVI